MLRRSVARSMPSLDRVRELCLINDRYAAELRALMLSYTQLTSATSTQSVSSSPSPKGTLTSLTSREHVVMCNNMDRVCYCSRSTFEILSLMPADPLFVVIYLRNGTGKDYESLFGPVTSQHASTS